MPTLLCQTRDRRIEPGGDQTGNAEEDKDDIDVIDEKKMKRLAKTVQHKQERHNQALAEAVKGLASNDFDEDTVAVQRAFLGPIEECEHEY
ncbi:hypothetical protein DOTSEDRAFT_23473 [Dothistroma septosporum NZE10]|uniref:Uncharacterized protein n=1 Tax=Dothistroma septosporum (strain NZE10 / CBS 128990) TaxID=675120 RepID=N1PR83_DOTSN|nr:hypothetical protein DOTSEDRAFT_23473 [Dothistroma septosporum NZE10]